MEEILDVYKRPYEPIHPLVCMDEVNTQLLADVRTPLPVEPGHPERQDYEYEREGVCNIFVAYELLAGKRLAQVRVQRAKRDWAQFMKEVLDEHYPTADKVVLVMDNLNTHSPASFYEVVPPAEAHRLARKLEIHYTHYTITVNGKSVTLGAWYYPHPSHGCESIANYVAFYPGKMDTCYVKGEKVQAQQSDFYGGWINSQVVGPFKDGPGTAGW